MKQRIRVVGVVRRGDEILLVKRRRGRLVEPVSWELPTGKIEFGEQPEEAMVRVMYDFLGVKVAEVRLVDVVSFVALVGSSQLNNLYIVFEVKIAERERIDLREKYTVYKYVKNTETGVERLDEGSLAVLAIEAGERAEGVQYRETLNGATVFVDGASRGNPGPAGIGYYILGEDGRELRRGGEFIGFATSRVAEYYAMKEGIEQAMELGLKNVRFVGDNLMVVNQLRGILKVKNADLEMIYGDIRKMLENFESCAFIHVNREQNENADREANLAIDRHFGRKM